MLYICRRTFGFHKDEDNISFTQFEKGIKSHQGRQLDFGTGLSRPSINVSLRNLTIAGAISSKKSPYGSRYKLNLNMDVEKVVNEINQLRKLTRIGKASSPKLVKRVNTQNLEKNGKPSMGPHVDNFRKLSKELARKMKISN